MRPPAFFCSSWAFCSCWREIRFSRTSSSPSRPAIEAPLGEAPKITERSLSERESYRSFGRISGERGVGPAPRCAAFLQRQCAHFPTPAAAVFGGAAPFIARTSRHPIEEPACSGDIAADLLFQRLDVRE